MTPDHAVVHREPRLLKNDVFRAEHSVIDRQRLPNRAQRDQPVHAPAVDGLRQGAGWPALHVWRAPRRDAAQ